MPKKLLHRAKLAWRDGDRDQALGLFDEGRRLHPDWLEESGAPKFAREQLQHLLNAGELERADQLILELSQEAPQAWLDALLVSYGDRVSADLRNGAWVRLAEREPSNKEAQKRCLELAIRGRDRERIVRHSEEVDPEETSWSATFMVDVAEANLLAARSERAQAWYAAAQDQDPQHVRAGLGRAALASDQGRFAESREAFDRVADQLTPPDPRSATALAYARRVWPLRATPAPAASLEIVLFTHVTGKLVHNKALAAPSTGLIERTWDSLQETLKPRAAKISVLFDSRPGPLEAPYRQNLQRFCRHIGAELVVSQQNGLRRQWLLAADRARSDLVMFVEHDWFFRPTCPEFETVRQAFEAAPEISYVRFSKHPNLKVPNHPAPAPPERPGLGPVCRMPEFLNQPHMIRRSVLNDLVVPLIQSDEAMDSFNDRAGGVEETVNAAITRCEKVFGLPFTLRLFGTFLWGELGAAKQIQHLGY